MPKTPPSSTRTTLRISTAFALTALVATACGSPPQTSDGAPGSKTIRVATVNNPDMVLMAKLAPRFTKETGIKVKFVTLPDQELRQKITQDVALKAGQYDVVTVGPYEVQSGWVKNGWLSPLDPQLAKLSQAERQAYDIDDLLPTIRSSLTVDKQLYALPFYGESSMTYYRKDLFAKAGLKMPANPTWEQIQQFAAKLDQPSQGQYGIILKGIPDYGQLAPFITLTHSFGASWFDKDWKAQFTSPKFKKAAQFYVDTVRKYGEPGASSVGFNEGLGLMAQGKGAIWVDATVAAGALNDPAHSKVAGKIGYAMAPTQGCTNGSHWLWTWSLGLESASKKKDDATKFLTWATSKNYVNLVAGKDGWDRVPPGTRTSTYQQAQYRKGAPWADITKSSIETSDIKNPSCSPVPYTGTAQVNVPEFADWAYDFGQGLSAAVAGKQSVDQWLSTAQTKANAVMAKAGYGK